MIRTRLLLLGGISLIMALLVGLTLYLASLRTSSALTNNKTALAVVNTVAGMETALHGYLIDGDLAKRQLWLTLHHRLNSQLSAFHFQKPEYNEIVQRMIGRVGALLGLFWKVEAGRVDLEGAAGDRRRLVEKRNRELANDLMKAGTEVVGDSSLLSKASYARLEKQALRAAYITMALVALMAVFIMGAVWWLSRSLIKPLSDLRRGTEKIGRGDLRYRIRSNRRDELGELARSFNTMAAEMDESYNWLRTEITEREKAEAELKESQSKFDQITQSITEVFWLTSPDWAEVHYISPAFDRIWGLPGEALYRDGMAWLDSVVEDDRTAITDHLKQVWRSGDYSGDFPEYRIVRPDGAIHWIKARHFPVVDDGGRVIRVAGICRDITETKKAGQALRRSERRFLDIASSTGNWIWEVDEQGRYTWVNPVATEILGYTAEEILGRPFYDFFHPDFLEEQRAAALETMARRQRFKNQLNVNRHRDGREVILEISGVPVIDEEGNFHGYRGVYRDVTGVKLAERDKKRLEEQLRQAHKMEAIGTLAGGIAHDFNNILAAIIGYADLTLDDLPEDSELRPNLEQITKSGRRARDLVKQILSFSRKAETNRRPIDPAPVIKETVKLLRATIPTTIEINFQLGRDLGLVETDPTLLHQLLLNLCTNAADAMRSQGEKLTISLDTITVDSKQASGVLDLTAGPHLRLQVKDQGEGISEGNLKRIFDPFFTTKGVGEGTGMGLAVVHGIVQDHGGAITVESEPGRGSLFTVYLPRLEPEQETEEIAQRPAAPSGGLEKILVVDDEPALVGFLEKMLERLDYKVAGFTSSRQALEAFEADPESFSAVITDMTMPGLTGLELATRVKDINPRASVIICTGHNENLSAKSEAELQDMGVDRLLMKPVSMSDMANTVRGLLDQR